MIIDFNKIEKEEKINFKGEEGTAIFYAYRDNVNKIFKIVLNPGCSIGLHSHENEVFFMGSANYKSYKCTKTGSYYMVGVKQINANAPYNICISEITDMSNMFDSNNSYNKATIKPNNYKVFRFAFNNELQLALNSSITIDSDHIFLCRSSINQFIKFNEVDNVLYTPLLEASGYYLILNNNTNETIDVNAYFICLHNLNEYGECKECLEYTGEDIEPGEEVTLDFEGSKEYYRIYLEKDSYYQITETSDGEVAACEYTIYDPYGEAIINSEGAKNMMLISSIKGYYYIVAEDINGGSETKLVINQIIY